MARPRKVDDEIVHAMVVQGKMHPTTVAGALKVHPSTVYQSLRRSVGRPPITKGERVALELLARCVRGDEAAHAEAIALLTDKGFDKE